jgi:hypothetical protein
MEIRRGFMPLLMELGGWEIDSCYKHVTPDDAPALQRRFRQCHPRSRCCDTVTSLLSTRIDAKFSAGTLMFRNFRPGSHV